MQGVRSGYLFVAQLPYPRLCETLVHPRYLALGASEFGHPVNEPKQMRTRTRQR